MASSEKIDLDLDIEDLVLANHILHAEGVVDSFGHVRFRSPVRPDRCFMARALGPKLVTANDILEYDAEGEPLDRQGRSVYSERFIHSEIYKKRPDVNAVIHSHSPGVIPFSITDVPLQAVMPPAAFLGTGVPVFEIREAAGARTDMLIRTPDLGLALAVTLDKAPYALMRGHGAVAVGGSLKQAVYRAIYAEVNARIQTEASRLGDITFLTEAEAANAAATNDLMVDRPWELWRKKLE